MIKSLLLIAALIAVPQLVGIGVDHVPAAANLPSVGPHTLPTRIDEFQGRDAPFDDDVKIATGASAIINRLYRNQLGDAVFVNVGVWTEYELGVPHNPEECYPSAGWETVSRRLLNV